MQGRNNNNLFGVDISNHNGTVNMTALKNAGVDVVYIKATEGRTYTDAYLNSNYNNAKAAGLKVGFYHFFHANSDIDQQVDNLCNALSGKTPECKIAIDVETPDGCSAGDITNGVISFAQKIKARLGYDAVIYTYTSFAKYNLDSRINAYPVWIAEYNGGKPPHDNGIWNNWIGFQFTDKGNVAGINGVADLNEFTNDILLNSVVNTPVGGDYMSKLYKNGSTIEVVYADDDLTIKVGTLDTYEQCEAIADINGKIVVLYNTPGGKKVGFVRYRGGL